MTSNLPKLEIGFDLSAQFAKIGPLISRIPGKIMVRTIRMNYEVGRMEDHDWLMAFTVVMAPFERVSSLAKGIFRWGRSKPANPDGHDLHRKQRWSLRRNKAVPGTYIGEREYLIFEPVEKPEFSVMVHVMSSGLPRSVSLLLPDAECITFESALEAKRRQGALIRVQRGGKEFRLIDASIGYETSNWTWEETGPCQDWEDQLAYAARYPSQRLTRQKIVECAKRIGFDPLQYYEKDQFARSSRLRD